MNIFSQSISQLDWPKERVSINLCSKCGDRFQLDLHQLKFDETLHSVRLGCSPGGIERVNYCDLMADAQRDLDRCQAELRRLEDLSNAFKEQQELLLMYMAGIRSVMSPIHKLSEDVLVEIFKYVCCDGIGTNCILSGSQKRLPTLTLSRVCIQWYNLVTSTPVLWSSFGTLDLEESSHNSSLFKAFLERSHLHPIDFVVHNSNTMQRKYLNIPEPPSGSLHHVAASANRWRRVTIRASEIYTREMLRPLIRCRQNLPALVSLNIESQIPDAIAFPMTCPNLQSLTLSEVALEFEAPLPAVTHLDLHGITLREVSRLIAWCPNVEDITLSSLFPEPIAWPTSLEVPLSAVKYLDLDGLTAEEAFRLIARCPNLQDITFNSFTEGFVAAPNTTSCVARRLAIRFGKFPSIVHLLCNMTFPGLVHLVLSDTHTSYDTRDINNLFPILERSFRDLTHLSLRNIEFLPGQLLRLFLCVPTVTVLDLKEYPKRDSSDIYLVLRGLIAPRQKGELEEPDKDGDNDEMTSDSEDPVYESATFKHMCRVEDMSLDSGVKFDFPEGLLLLPRLKELNLVIRPRNKLLLQLVRSRWRPSVLLVPSDDVSGSGACVCLQTLRMKCAGDPGPGASKRLRELKKSLYRFKKAGMVVEVSK